MSCKIELGEKAGFCFGVNRAIELVEKLLDEGKKVCTLGPIIHNPQMVERLANRGVKTVETVDEVPDGYTVVIRSHGVDKATYEKCEQKGLEVCDATCPFVYKIHKIVEKNTDENTPVFIAGDKDHAEVVGIMGFAASDVYCFKDEEELQTVIEKCQNMSKNPPIVVSQTTFNAKKWEIFKKIIKKVYTNAIFFDTICDATTERQNEAEELAKKADLMVVIGGKHSSNTKKLFEICSKRTKTVLIETADELNPAEFKSVRFVGVTAGASTPAVIIKEVLNTMTEILKNEETMAEEVTAETKMEAETKLEKSFDDMTFEEALEESLNSMNSNQRVKGVVVAVNPTEVQVDIGRKYTGIVPANELSAEPNVNPVDLVKVGDEIDLIVMRTNDQEGIITLSKKRFDSHAGIAIMEEAKESGAVLEGNVSAVVKGGITVVSNGVRVFIPASQATLTRNEDLNDLVGTTVSFKVIDIRRGRNVVGSIRVILREEQKKQREAAWAAIEEGATYEGVVKSLTSYGAFVDIGGVDGMIHITELAWTRIKHPSEVVNVGDTVTVYVKELDKENKKISLGFKKAEDNPWEIIKTKYQVGDTATVKIVSFASYGAFANLMTGIDGLIHISQIANKRIEKPQDVLEIGQEVEVQIVGIDFDAKRVSLSIRALLPEEVVEEVETEPEAPAEPPKGYVCQACGYVEGGETLAEDFVCPLCGVGADQFKPLVD
ncbi:MAG: bifunctional 4-hydroxy-3-methylbut-2-enyl diphosphate reductase/30S ribosomal protein S1 [Clostridia bacterium]|nr:bifunctional 4-hydroxy-3-methylbut-2-enyl diphosphate reductase/30S ribosomal protein S1 [Clostridia bacterium]